LKKFLNKIIGIIILFKEYILKKGKIYYLISLIKIPIFFYI